MIALKLFWFMGILATTVSAGKIWNLKDGSNTKLINQNKGDKVTNVEIYQGDIKLRPRDINRIEGRLSDATVVESAKWDVTTIPYEFDTNLGILARQIVKKAIEEYKSKTCIRFRKKTGLDSNYLYIVKEDGCWSSVGKTKGQQKVSLGDGCETKSTAVHELLHALGFWHEQSRPDRNKYVKIQVDNIMKGQSYNFNIEKSRSFNYPYDYDSVMHYSNDAFSKNGEKTIIALGDSNKIFGQGDDGGLSKIDALQLNAFYCGGSLKSTSKPKIAETTVSVGTTATGEVISTTDATYLSTTFSPEHSTEEVFSTIDPTTEDSGYTTSSGDGDEENDEDSLLPEIYL